MIKVHMDLKKHTMLSTGIAIAEWVCLTAVSGGICALVAYGLDKDLGQNDFAIFTVWSILWLGGFLTYNNIAYKWARCAKCHSHAMFIKSKGECAHCEAEFLIEYDGIWMTED